MVIRTFGAKIRFNRMSWTREIELSSGFIYKDDAQNSALSLVEYIAELNEFPGNIKKIDRQLTYIAQKQSYHPVLECIYAKLWDGTPRLDQFIQTLKTEQPFAQQIIKTWMVAGIAAAHSEDGFVNNGVLVLQGDQKIGKTTWVRNLDPTPNGRAVKEGAFLDPREKDSIVMMSSYWIVELGELETIFKKSDIGRLKAFITTQFDHVRFSYAIKPTQMPRRSIYIATVNQANFLVDDTGNRRWWTIAVSEIDNKHGLDMQQVWAETYQEWLNGHLWYLSEELEREVNFSNEKHEKICPYTEMLGVLYDWESAARRKMTVTEVLIEMKIGHVNDMSAHKMGSIIKKFTGCESKKYNGKKVFEIPFLLYKS